MNGSAAQGREIPPPPFPFDTVDRPGSEMPDLLIHTPSGTIKITSVGAVVPDGIAYEDYAAMIRWLSEWPVVEEAEDDE